MRSPEFDGERRIVVHISPDNTFPAAKDPRRQCRSTIKLDGRMYRCGRAKGALGFHEGIHDAFTVHGDGGLCRW